MAVALAGLEEGIITPDFHVTASWHANFYGRDFKCWRLSKGGHGIDRSAPRDRANRATSTSTRSRNMVGVDKINKWATAARAWACMSGIDLPNEVAGPGAVHRVEARRRCTRSGTRARRSRSASARASVADAGLDGRLHGDARQRRHARHAAPAQGGRRWQRVEAGADAGAASRRSTIDPEKLQAIRDGMWMVVNEPLAPATTRSIAGHDVVRQDRDGAGHFESGQGARRGRRTGPARQRLVRVLRAARQPADRRRRVPRARRARRQRGAGGASHSRHVLREEGRQAAAAQADDRHRI